MMMLAEPTTSRPISTKALIITNSPERLRSTILLEAHTNIDWFCSSICPGIPRRNTRELFEQEIVKANLPVPQDHVYETLSLSEVGCIYAHLGALTIAAQSDGPTLILEDDAEFQPENLRQILQNLEWLPEDAIVKLEGYDKEGSRMVLGPKSTNANFALSMRPSNGSAGYVVTPLSASRLLQAGIGYCHPYDMLLNDPKQHGCFLLDAIPFPIRQASETESTISRGRKKRGLINRLIRHKEKLDRRLARYSLQILRAKEAGFFRIRFAKFYEN